MQKNRPLPKSMQTAVAVLSTLLAFSCLCALSLFALNRLGVFEIPRAAVVETTDPVSHRISLPEHIGTNEAIAMLARPEDKAEELLGKMPFIDAYYLLATVVTVTTPETETTPAVTEKMTYNLWRFGDKFRINQYNSALEAVQLFICDGTQVRTVDYQQLIVSTVKLDEAHSYAVFSPFSYLLSTDAITSFSVQGGILEVTRQSDVANETVRKTITTYRVETGLPVSYMLFEDGVLKMTVEFSSADTGYVFYDYMFDFD